MAVVRRVRRLVNPSRRRRRANPKRRRKLTPAQLAAGFGGKRRQAAAGRKRHKRRTLKANPKRKSRVRVVYRTRTKYKTRTRTVVKHVRSKRSKNPRSRVRRRRRMNNPLLVTFGPALNPRRKRSKKSVARKRRRSNPRRRHHAMTHRRARRRNPVRVVYRTRSRRRRHMSNPRRRRMHRNPVSFSGAKDMAVAVLAGLGGVTITKMVPSLLTSLTSGSPIMAAAVSAVTAWGAGYLAEKMLGPNIGKAVAFGGYMQAGSVALNAFLPSVGSVIGLSGLRGLTPSNDILLPYNMFAGRGAMLSAGSPQAGAVRSPGGGTGFAPAFA
jgi:hypothetical protein